MNTVDAQLELTRFMTDNTIVMWEKELNTSGNSFNFDSQDIYRQYMINILMFDFKDRIDSAKDTQERKEILSQSEREVLYKLKSFTDEIIYSATKL